MSAIRNVAGQKFGSLTAIRRLPLSDKNRHSRWLFMCDCGQELSSLLTNVSTGKTVSCGCYGRAISTSHGMCRTLEYSTWASIKERCQNPNSKDYHRYGGAGISLYQEWADSFSSFYAYVGPKPSLGHSIDRINVYGNYEPGNVRWATLSQQARNKRKSRYVIFNGNRVPLKQATDDLGIPYTTATSRMRRGETPEQAITPGQRTPQTKRVFEARVDLKITQERICRDLRTLRETLAFGEVRS